MQKPNNYIRQRDADREKFVTAGCDLAKIRIDTTPIEAEPEV